MTLRSLAEVCNFDFFTPSKLRRHAFFGLEQTQPPDLVEGPGYGENAVPG